MAAPEARNDQSNHPQGIAGMHLFAKLDGGGRCSVGPIVDFLAGRPTLSITVRADWGVTSVTTETAAVAAWEGSVGVR